MEELSELLSDVRVLPLMTLGSGCSSLAHTFQADNRCCCFVYRKSKTS